MCLLGVSTGTAPLVAVSAGSSVIGRGPEPSTHTGTAAGGGGHVRALPELADARLGRTSARTAPPPLRG